MNPLPDSEYEAFTRLIDHLSLEKLDSMLSMCEEYTEAIKEDPTYDRLAQADHLVEILLDTQRMAYGHEDPARMWLSTLKTISAANDFKILATQFALFIISQERNQYRIEDDQLRLLVTYTHIKIINKILEDQ